MFKKIATLATVGVLAIALVGCKSITQEEALNAAYKHAGIDNSKTSVNLYSQEMDDDGFNFEFEANGFMYDYEISKSGKVKEYEKQEVVTNNNINNTQNQSNSGSENNNSSGMTEKDATAKAYEIFGVSESDVEHLVVKIEFEDGIEVFEVEFFAGDKEYSCEINKSNGNVISQDIDSIYN